MRLMMARDDNLDKIRPERKERGQNLRGESGGNAGVLKGLTCTTGEELKPCVGLRLRTCTGQKKRKARAAALIWKEGRLPVAAGGSG